MQVNCQQGHSQDVRLKKGINNFYCATCEALNYSDPKILRQRYFIVNHFPKKPAIKAVQKTGKCCICKQSTTQRYGLKWACSMEHALEFTAKAKAKNEERKRLDARKTIKARKENIKTLAKLCAEARVIIQRYCRLRDAPYLTCICCGIGAIEHGGHRFAVGSKYRCARLSLDPRQIHGCCIRCNVFVGGGNTSGYDAGLIHRYGAAYLASLLDLKRKADSGEDAPLTKAEVRLIKSEYLAKCRALVKGRPDHPVDTGPLDG